MRRCALRYCAVRLFDGLVVGALFLLIHDRLGGPEQSILVQVMALLMAGRTDVWDAIVNRVEARLIQTALANTRGRRIEAAQKLGIGRNTITRKIQELDL